MQQRFLGLLRGALPMGQTLPDEVWWTRHRVLLGILFLHALGLPVFGVAQGYGLTHGLVHGAAPAAMGLAALSVRHRRRVAAALVSLGLVTSSALLVHIWNGVIEGHFHFFVVIVVLALYEDWVPFLLAAAYVVIHHGLTGAVDPGAVYNHADAVAHPWKWAAIHGVFVTCAGIASVAAWRLNESVREETGRKQRQLAEAQRVGQIGSWEWDIRGDELQWSDELCRIFGLEPGRFPRTYKGYLERVHPEDRDYTNEVVQRAYTSFEPYSFDHRVMRPDGTVRVVQGRGSVVAVEGGQALRMAGTAQDITDRKRAEQLKEEFFALVSHELRTPLTSIRGYLDLLIQDTDRKPSDQEFLGIIERNATRLERLVGDLLFAAQLEAGTLALEWGAADLSAIAAACVEAARPRAEEMEIQLSLQATPVPVCKGDPDRLAQALDNLISNALKYTPARGSVDVRVAQENGSVLVNVEDTGVGVPSADQEHLFERFFRASSATERSIPGVGLGLTITKAIVDGHGGSIDLDSREGVGTTFHVELPLA